MVATITSFALRLEQTMNSPKTRPRFQTTKETKKMGDEIGRRRRQGNGGKEKVRGREEKGGYGKRKRRKKHGNMD